MDNITFVNSELIKVAEFVAAFMFASLIGIIIYLVKEVKSKVDTIIINQDKYLVQITTVITNSEFVKTEIKDIKTELKQVQTLSTEHVKLKSTLENQQVQINDFKQLTLENNRQLSELFIINAKNKN